jgi:cytochrome c-type biogenesis protein CcmE
VTGWAWVLSGYVLSGLACALYLVWSGPRRAPATTRPPSTGTPGVPRGRRWRLTVVVLAVLATVAVLAVAGISGTEVYYRTPTEIVADRGLIGEQVRVGGLVAPGSVRRSGQRVSFTLTDGATALPVTLTARTNGVFAAGRNALVAGHLSANGNFRADDLMVKHDNNYRGANGPRPTEPPVGANVP